MSIFVNRENLIATCEDYFKETFKKDVDALLQEQSKDFRIEEKRFFPWIKKSRVRIGDHIHDKAHFFDWMYEVDVRENVNWFSRYVFSGKQYNFIKTCYKRAKGLDCEWIPISDRELEYFKNWWVSDTKFFAPDYSFFVDANSQ